MTDRVRALLVTPEGDLLTIRRVRPGQDTYWVLPGGGVEDGEGLEAALARELQEEIAGTAEIHSLIFILGHDGGCQYIYLTRVRSWSPSADDRSGPEFEDATSGDYDLQRIPLTAEALEGIDLRPDVLAQFLLARLSEGTDLFDLPDLRAGQAART